MLLFERCQINVDASLRMIYTKNVFTSESIMILSPFTNNDIDMKTKYKSLR